MATTSETPRYVPALRFHSLTRFFDKALAATLPERRFKEQLVEQVAVAPGQSVLDVGSGTGTLAIMLKQAAPEARVIGLDGDSEILEIARQKTREAGLEIELRQGMAYALPFEAGTFDRVVSSLVFHHLSPEDKKRTLAEIRRVLKPGGEFHLLDWGRAQDPVMRLAFLGVQVLDGFANTRENVRGELPSLMKDAGLVGVRETRRCRTILGTLSIYRAETPNASQEG